MRPYDLPNHKLEFGKSPLSPKPLPAYSAHGGDPNEESPESQWLFGAAWGAQPQRTPRGKHGKANVFSQKRTYAAPPTPFSAFPRLPFPRSFVLRRDRHKKTHHPEVN